MADLAPSDRVVGGGFCVLGVVRKARAVEGEILQDDNPVLQDDKGRGCGGGRDPSGR